MSFAAAVHVKGLPYSATEADIREFFRECDVVHVYMLRKPGTQQRLEFPESVCADPPLCRAQTGAL